MLSRSLDKAREAYKNRSVEHSRRAHDQSRAEATEEHRQEQGRYVKSLIYGGLDGIITTFAVVAGVAGASLSVAVVLILGLANLIADGLSMAIGDYLSTKAENEYARAERERERWEVEHYPEGERREMVELYMDKGIERQDAETVTGILSKHPEAWVSIMMVEELGIVESEESPLHNALVTFVSFGVLGFVPLLAYVFLRFAPALQGQTFWMSAVLTGLTLFSLGALKVRITARNWFTSGLEMLLVGGLAAAAAYGIGRALAGLA
ncbi:MAG: VIT1/CCC1 transporter family protein [Spirochaetales bacterium]|nr:VIT1/CCC1 transporter family protein [Spirochaetales bacterium]